jgi:hypothetical protein
MPEIANYKRRGQAIGPRHPRCRHRRRPERGDSPGSERIFTPATKAVFNIIPGDIGRPLADLSALAADDALLTDARSVPRTLMPREREVEALGGALYIRRISP